MKTPSIVFAAATLAFGSLVTSAAEARGLRVGLGFGIGVGIGVASHAFSGRSYGGSRTETVVNGRYRCCVEREVETRRAKSASRHRHVEEDEGDEKPAKKVSRKKRVKEQEREIVVKRRAPKSAPKVAPHPLPTSLAKAEPAKPASVPAKSTPEVAKFTDASVVAPVATQSPSAVSGLAPVALAAQTPPANPSMEVSAVPAASVPQANVAAAAPAYPTAGLPQGSGIGAAGQGASDAAPRQQAMNCQKYYPSLGKSLPVPCF